MLEKHKFPGLLAGTMLLLLLVFIAFSSLTYLAYGAEIDTIVLLNLPQQNRLTQATVFLYALAMMATFPLQFFPAIRILDRLVFPRHKLINAQLLKINQVEGNPEPPPSYDTLESLPEPYQHGRISWTVTIQKNAFRGFIVACLVGIAIVGASQLESFISLIGAICCVPLAFIYPTLFHLKLVAETRWVKVVDIFIAGFGILAFIGCTAITIYVWVTQTPAGHHPCKNQTEYW